MPRAKSCATSNAGGSNAQAEPVTDTSYQSTYRRSEMAMPALLGVLAVLAGLIFLAVSGPFDGDTVLAALPFFAGALILAIAFIGFAAFRVHRWTLETNGVRIEERPKFPLTGFRRVAVLPFTDIAALNRVQSGFDVQLEIRTRDGNRYRLPQAFRTSSPGLYLPDPESLETFARSLRTASAAAGVELPLTGESLSFWNGIVGLGLLTIMFFISVAIAALAAWALWEGTATRPRAGQVEAICILLPFGAAYLLFRSLKRRRAVLARVAAERPAAVKAS
jgi:hypothetical protein